MQDICNIKSANQTYHQINIFLLFMMIKEKVERYIFLLLSFNKQRK